MSPAPLRRAFAPLLRSLIDDGEPDRAEWLLVRAEADAELAIASTREAEQKLAALELRTTCGSI